MFEEELKINRFWWSIHCGFEICTALNFKRLPTIRYTVFILFSFSLHDSDIRYISDNKRTTKYYYLPILLLTFDYLPFSHPFSILLLLISLVALFSVFFLSKIRRRSNLWFKQLNGFAENLFVFLTTQWFYRWIFNILQRCVWAEHEKRIKNIRSGWSLIWTWIWHLYVVTATFSFQKKGERTEIDSIMLQSKWMRESGGIVN